MYLLAMAFAQPAPNKWYQTFYNKYFCMKETQVESLDIVYLLSKVFMTRVWKCTYVYIYIITRLVMLWHCFGIYIQHDKIISEGNDIYVSLYDRIWRVVYVRDLVTLCTLAEYATVSSGSTLSIYYLLTRKDLNLFYYFSYDKHILNLLRGKPHTFSRENDIHQKLTLIWERDNVTIDLMMC